MPDYSALVTALGTTAQIWIELDGPLVDGVFVSQSFLLPASARATLKAALASIPVTPDVPPPIVPDEDMVAVEEINIRSAPNQSLPKIGTVQKGDKLTVNGSFPFTQTDGKIIHYTLIKAINGLKQNTPAFTGREWLTPAVVPAPIPVPEPPPIPIPAPSDNIVTRYVNADPYLKRHTQPDVHSDEIKPGLVDGTKVQIDGGTLTNGYVKLVGQDGWVSAQYLQPFESKPTIPQPPPVSSFKTKWGLHVIWGGDYNAIQGMARDGLLPGITNMKYAGRSDALSNKAIKDASGGRTLILNRWYNERDPLVYPDWNKDDLAAEGAALCQQYYDLYLRNDPDSLLADWQQLFNEPTSIGHGPGMASFWLGAMKKAEQLGIRLAIGCFSERFPPLPSEVPEFWIPFFDTLRYAKAHGHIYMLHGYIAPDPGGSWTNEASMLRHRLELSPDDLHDMPTVYAEYGTAYGAEMSDDAYIDGVSASDAELMKDPNVLFVSGWSAGGGGGWPRSNINGKIPRLIAYAQSR